MRLPSSVLTSCTWLVSNASPCHWLSSLKFAVVLPFPPDKCRDYDRFPPHSVKLIPHSELCKLCSWKSTINRLKTTELKVLLYALRNSSEAASLVVNVPRLQPLVLLVKVTCGTEGMMQTRENRSTRRKPCLSATLSNTNQTDSPSIEPGPPRRKAGD
jgi:hypothetical protein